MMQLYEAKLARLAQPIAQPARQQRLWCTAQVLTLLQWKIIRLA